jgi:hypothetical protein
MGLGVEPELPVAAAQTAVWFQDEHTGVCLYMSVCLSVLIRLQFAGPYAASLSVCLPVCLSCLSILICLQFAAPCAASLWRLRLALPWQAATLALASEPATDKSNTA